MILCVNKAMILCVMYDMLKRKIKANASKIVIIISKWQRLNVAKRFNCILNCVLEQNINYYVYIFDISVKLF